MSVEIKFIGTKEVGRSTWLFLAYCTQYYVESRFPFNTGR